ncbi:MAG: response regulator [Candidatus Aureabacteria bacterium]|nr:response regulator [Candidatus Auribacterota bacterium]
MKIIKVLIVDDDRDLGENLVKILNMDGYRAVFTHDGRRALEMMASEQPDVVILDIKMPGMDGMEVLKKLKEYSGKIAVIILTAFPSLESAVDAVRDKIVFDYIRKPFSLRQIQDTVAKAAASLGLVSCPEESLNARIGENIRRQRNLKNMNSRELARMAGLSPSLLSQVESGKSAASLKTLYRLARALKVEMGEMVKDL